MLSSKRCLTSFLKKAIETDFYDSYNLFMHSPSANQKQDILLSI